MIAPRPDAAPYIPPAAPPLENPLTLPSLFYFTNVLPAQVDLVFKFALPGNAAPAAVSAPPSMTTSLGSSMCGRSGRASPPPPLPLALPAYDRSAAFNLVNVATRMPSPQWPNGHALVCKYARARVAQGLVGARSRGHARGPRGAARRTRSGGGGGQARPAAPHIVGGLRSKLYITSMQWWAAWTR